MKHFLVALVFMGITAAFVPAARDKEPQKFLLERSYSVKKHICQPAYQTQSKHSGRGFVP